MRHVVLRLALCCVAAAATAGGARVFGDPVDTPAVSSARPTSTPMIAVTRAGAHFVAVGLRGTVLLSDAAGQQWRQAAVPVSSDLVAVHFATPEHGWATGHDGVILHTADGGRTWEKQLEGRRLEALLRVGVRERADAGDAAARHLQEEIDRDFERGTQQPLLGVWFADERNGYAVGSFGIIVATHDGGRNWESWQERIENPDLLHLFAIGEAAGQVFITSEKGVVFRLDAVHQRFVALNAGYQGSLFGLVADGDGVIAFGLRGNALRSADAGAHWQKLATGTISGLNGGAVASRRRILIASQGGQLLASSDRGQTFGALPGLNPAPFAGVAVANDVAVVVGLNGVQTLAVPLP